MNKEQADPRFWESLRLFKEEKYFESHEVMEGLWLEDKNGTYGDLYKGIIQAAAAFLLLKRGTLSGSLQLFKSSTRYLKPYEPCVFGFDVSGLVRQMAERFKKI